MLKLAIIADDMTGLNAVASEFQRYGLRVRTFSSIDGVTDALAAGCDVLGVDTNSRMMSPDAAHAAVLSATRTLAALSPQIIMKQTDSLLQGNVSAELRAVLHATSAEQLAFAPACPSLGRLTRDGVHVFRHGNDYAQDITMLLSDGDGIAVARASTGGTLQGPEDERRILIWDASTDYDLDQVVTGALSNGSSLFGGSVGLAKALARHLWAQETRRRQPAFLVLGSFQSRTRTQCAVLMQTGSAELVELPEETSDLSAAASKVVSALKTGRHAVLMTTAGPRSDFGDASYPFLDEATRMRIETGMRLVVADVLAECRNQISGMLVAGGTTTATVTRDVLAVTGFEDVTYLDDGVAAGMGLAKNDKPIPFITKAGTWGDDDVLLRSIHWLQTAAPNFRSGETIT